MARQIHIDSDYTIQQWIDSQNTMSDYMGDLDNFENRFKITPLDTHPGYNDSSFVTALNFINDPWVEYLRGLFTGGKAKITAELLVDSAAFGTLRLADSSDSSAQKGLFGPQYRPRFSKFYTQLMANDSDVIARHPGFQNGDDPTSTSIYVGAGNRWPNPDAPGIASFDYDLYVQDSAWFRNIRVGGGFTDAADSVEFTYLTIHDSSEIGGLSLKNDSTRFIKFNTLDVDSSSTIDSAYIGYLRSTNIDNDSSTFGILRINNTIVLDSDDATLTLQKDNKTFDGISQFTIEEPAATIVFGAYLLDSV